MKKNTGLKWGDEESKKEGKTRKENRKNGNLKQKLSVWEEWEGKGVGRKVTRDKKEVGGDLTEWIM